MGSDRIYSKLKPESLPTGLLLIHSWCPWPLKQSASVPGSSFPSCFLLQGTLRFLVKEKEDKFPSFQTIFNWAYPWWSSSTDDLWVPETAPYEQTSYDLFHGQDILEDTHGDASYTQTASFIFQGLLKHILYDFLNPRISVRNPLTAKWICVYQGFFKLIKIVYELFLMWFLFSMGEDPVSIMNSKSFEILKRLETDVNLDYFSHSDILWDSDHVSSIKP